MNASKLNLKIVSIQTRLNKISLFHKFVQDKKTKEPKPEKTKADKTKSNDKAKVESKTASKQEEPEEPVEDDSGYLVPAELLRAQKQLSQEEKGGEPKERSSIGISLGKHYTEISFITRPVTLKL